MTRDELAVAAALVAGAVIGTMFVLGRRHRRERWRLLTRLNASTREVALLEELADDLIDVIGAMPRPATEWAR